MSKKLERKRAQKDFFKIVIALENFLNQEHVQTSALTRSLKQVRAILF